MPRGAGVDRVRTPRSVRGGLTAQPPSPAPPAAWYSGVTRAQWVVLAVASAGWVFDAFEGQLFNITRAHMLPELLGTAKDAPEV